MRPEINSRYIIGPARLYFNKRLRKLITGLMAFLMLAATILPAKQVSAYTYSEPESVEVEEKEEERVEYRTTTDSDFDSSKVEIIAEAKDLRTADTKTFLKADGTYVAVLYGDVVHYLDNGKYEDIDLTLSYSGDSLSYSTKANSFKVEFPELIEKDKTVKLTQGDYEVAWSLNTSDRASIAYSENIEKSSDPKILTKTSQSVQYERIMDGVAIEYIVTGSSVKENIILDKYIKDFSLSFTYSLANLSLVSKEDGSYVFVNGDKEEVFKFDSLYMYDAKDEESFDVVLRVEEGKEGNYTVTVIPDPEWLKTAVYPVTIDPTISSIYQSFSIQDTYINKLYPTSQSYYNNNSFYVANGSWTGSERRGLLSFVMPDMSGKVITYAHLTLYKWNTQTTERTIAIHHNTSSFTASSVTWNSWMTPEPRHRSEMVDYVIVNQGKDTPYTFNITKSVREWVEGVSPNYGFTIKDKANVGAYTAFYSSESAKKPVIEIGYIDAEGLKSFWTYQTFDAGEAGAVYVADYTGLMTLVRQDLSFSTERDSLGLTMVYNIVNRNTDIGYGSGWRTNYSMEVIYDANLLRYYTIDATGSKVYYQPTEYIDDENLDILYDMEDYGMSSNYYISEDGSNQFMFVLIDEWSEVCGIYIMTDNYTLYSFGWLYQSRYLLTHITEDAAYDYPKTTIISRNAGSPDKLYRITDSVGNYIQMDYNGNGKLSSANLYLKHPSPASDTTTTRALYEYTSPTSGVYLLSGRQIEKDYDRDQDWTVEGEAEYTYDASRRLVEAASVGSGKVVLTYNATTHKITEANSYRTDGVNEYLFSTLSYDYALRKTTVTDQDDNYIINKFDDYGHTVNIIDSQGTAQSFVYANIFKDRDDTSGIYTLIDGTPNYKNNHSLLSMSTPQISQANPVYNGEFFVFDPEGSWDFVKEVGSDAEIYFIDGIMDIGEQYFEPQPRSGDWAIRIRSTNDEGAYLKQEVVLSAGTYTLSGYVYNDSDSDTGVSILAEGDVYGSQVIQVPIASVWQEVNHYFVVDTTATVTIKLSSYGAGIVCFDAIQITKGFSNSRVNLVDNPSFEHSTGYNDAPYLWDIYDPTNVTREIMSYDSTLYEDLLGEYGIKIVGSPTTKRFCQYWNNSFVSYMSGAGSLLIGAWAKSEGTPTSMMLTDSYERVFRVKITQYNAVLSVKDVHYIDFDTSVEGWQYNFASIPIKHEDDVKHIKITLEYQGEGIVYFDNVQVYFEPAFTNYTYDANGRIVAIARPGGTTTTYTYPANNPFTRTPEEIITETLSAKFTHSGGDVSAVEINGELLVEPVKNVHGQSTSVSVGFKDGQTVTPYYSTSTAYLATGFNQYVESTTNEFGKSTNYYNDVYTGLLLGIKNALGDGAQYNYDDVGNLIEVLALKDYSGVSPITEGKIAYAYDELNRLVKICLEYDDISSPTYFYEITYDSQGRMDEVKVNNNPLMTYAYSDNHPQYSQNIKTQTYGNLDSMEFIYNDLGQVTSVGFKPSGENDYITRFTYVYDKMGNLNAYSEVVFIEEDEEEEPKEVVLYREFYSYDGYGRIDAIIDKDGNTIDYGYDDLGNLASIRTFINGVECKTEYEYFKDEEDDNLGKIKMTVVTTPNDLEIVKTREYEELALRRLSSITFAIGTAEEFYTQEFTYEQYTSRIAEITYVTEAVNGTDYAFHYVYDDLGIVVEESYYEDEVLVYKVDYEYDAMNQLIVEDRWFSAGGSYTTVYQYDARGNRTASYELAYGLRSGQALVTTLMEYSEDWLDQLSGYAILNNNAAEMFYVITYDDQGNPTIVDIFIEAQLFIKIYYTWEGRQLIAIDITDGDISDTILYVTYHYNDKGYRVSKTVYDALEDSTVTTNYFLDGDKVLRETDGTNNIYYHYDVDGSLIGFTYNEEDYIYIKNLQGDIIAITDTSGITVVKYIYDAYGNFEVVVTAGYGYLADANPYTYRGYRYDQEIGLYYLNSRYYDPVIGRFISSDGLLGQTGNFQSHNMYAYCANNPVMHVDPRGEAWWHWALAATAVVVCAAIVVASAGTAAAGIAAVIAVGNGVAAATTASTVAAGALIASSIALGTSAFVAATNSNSLQDFADQGNWGTVAVTVASAAAGAYMGYSINQNNKYRFPNSPDEFNPNNLVRHDYNNGNVIKWQEHDGGIAIFEYNTHDIPHYHLTPNGADRMINPFTNDTHMYPGDPIPREFWHFFN